MLTVPLVTGVLVALTFILLARRWFAMKRTHEQSEPASVDASESQNPRPEPPPQSQDTSAAEGLAVGAAVGAALAVAGIGYYAYSASMQDVLDSSPMPHQWRDTPRNQQKWSRMQHNERFLRRQQMRHGVLTCHYCGRKPLEIMSWEESSRMSHYARLASNQATADHVVPRSKGGDDSDSNLVVACFKCNYEKGSS